MRELAPWIMGPALLLLSGGLLWWQLRDDSASAESADNESATFLRRQWWRRMQVAVLIGLVGLAILIGPWINEPLAAGIYWLGVVLIVIWIGVLGLIDMWASRDRLDEEAKRIDQERSQIIAELDQQKRALRSKRTTKGNGDGK